MKNKFSLVFLILILIGSSNLNAQIKLGIEGDYSFTTFRDKKVVSDQYKFSNLIGYRAGINAEVQMQGPWYIQTGLLLARKGGLTTAPFYSSQGGSNYTLKLNYLELPINVIGKYEIKKGLTAYVGTGLYFAYALSGKQNGTSYDKQSGTTYTFKNEDVSLSDNDAYYNDTENGKRVRPFDYGFNLLGGVEYKSIRLGFNFDQGFKNIYPTRGTQKIVNQTYSISVSYLLPMIFIHKNTGIEETKK